MIGAMNAMGYAACALGNHEFNYGLDFLEIALAGANFPALSCNVLRPDGSFLFQALDHSGADAARRGGRGAAPAHRRDRLHAAADRAMGPEPSERPRDDGRDRRSGARSHSGVARAGASISSSRCATPAFPPAAAAAGRRERRAGAGGGRRRRRDVPRPPALAAAGRGFRRDRRRRRRQGRRAQACPPSCPASGAAISASSILPLERAGAGWRVAAAKVEARPIYKREGDAVSGAGRGRRRRARRGASRARGDASLCPLARRRHRFADQFLFRAGRRRSVGADRQRRADLVRRAARQNPAGAGRICRFSPRRRRSSRAAAAGRTITPTSRPGRSRSRTSRTSISIPTPCAR